MFKTFLKYLFVKLTKTFEKEVKQAHKWVDNTQERFNKMIDDSVSSEQKIDMVISDARVQIAELNRIIAQALADKEQISNLQSKVADVVKEKE